MRDMIRHWSVTLHAFALKFMIPSVWSLAREIPWNFPIVAMHSVPVMMIFFSCSKPCGCDLTYEPVCVYLPTGEVLTFDNPCLAECAGHVDFIHCDSTHCACDTHYDPVCFVTDEGEVLRFSNLCEAECRGYPQAMPCEDCICPDIIDPVLCIGCRW